MVLSRREKQILDKLVETLDINSTADSLRISPSTVYNVLYRLRKKQRKARLIINTLLNYKRRSSIIDKVLSSKVTLAEETQLMREDTSEEAE